MTSITTIQPSHARISDASKVGLHCQHGGATAASGFLTGNRPIGCLEDPRIAMKKC